jgi:uncharacterized protein (DUF433 family)
MKLSNSGIMERMATEHLSKSSTPPVISEYIAIDPEYCNGQPHIIGHRIKVQHVAVWHERMGMTPDEIVATYPTITLPAVHAALAYYYGHRAEIDSAIADDDRFVDDMETKAVTSTLSQKLERQRAQSNQIPPG